MIHVPFAGRLVMLGCGSIGQGVLPLILHKTAEGYQSLTPAPTPLPRIGCPSRSRR